MKCDEALKIVEESYRKASQFFRGTDPEILNDYAKYITLLKEDQGLDECSVGCFVECDKRHEAFIRQHVKSVMEKLIDDVVEGDEKQKKQEAYDRQHVKGVMDDLINAVIEANPRAEMSEVPPPKKARTTPTDTIETMEEPDSKIGTTIPKSETQSEAPPLKKTRTCSKVCASQGDDALWIGVDESCLKSPSDKGSTFTKWPKNYLEIQLLEQIEHRDETLLRKKNEAQLPSDQTYLKSSARGVNMKKVNKKLPAGGPVPTKGMLCPNCYQRRIHRWANGL